MTIVNSEIYLALRDAEGVSEEKARIAAEAVAVCGQSRADLALRLAEIRHATLMVRWMLATLIMGVAVLLLGVHL